MRTYTQLTERQRYHISAQREAGHTRAQIAKRLRVHHSTISRELARNRSPQETTTQSRLTSVRSSVGMGNLIRAFLLRYSRPSWRV